MNNINATLVVEADRLDRYGKTGIIRFKTMFGKEKIRGPYWEEAKKTSKRWPEKLVHHPHRQTFIPKACNRNGIV